MNRRNMAPPRSMRSLASLTGGRLPPARPSVWSVAQWPLPIDHRRLIIISGTGLCYDSLSLPDGKFRITGRLPTFFNSLAPV